MKDSCQKRGILLSKSCIFLFAAGLVFLCIGAPWLFSAFIKLRSPFLDGKLPLLLLTTYTAAVPAALALYDLHRLLYSIEANAVFTAQNTAALGRLSLCCLLAALICLASTFYYPSFAVPAAAGAFLALILYVLKNVFRQAVSIKDENDYTI